jgi:hypothetical protein
VVDIYLEYQGDLHCRAVHGPSSAVLVTDAPVDNQGRGESFSPTDLVATGLGSCMATVMGIIARKHGYALEGTRVHVKKTMTATKPRRNHPAQGGHAERRGRSRCGRARSQRVPGAPELARRDRSTSALRLADRLTLLVALGGGQGADAGVTGPAVEAAHAHDVRHAHTAGSD